MVSRNSKCSRTISQASTSPTRSLRAGELSRSVKRNASGRAATPWRGGGTLSTAESLRLVLGKLTMACSFMKIVRKQVMGASFHIRRERTVSGISPRDRRAVENDSRWTHAPQGNVTGHTGEDAMSHSASPRMGIRTDGLARCPHPFEPADFAGFSYFLGRPGPGQRSRLGENPAEAQRL